ncbi:MAG: hypothetical protein WD398_08290 [Cyclobacteriaceae bacterium]
MANGSPLRTVNHSRSLILLELPKQERAIRGFKVAPFVAQLEIAWNAVLDQASNATLMHRRSFLEYHGEGFEDCSLLIFLGDRPVAVFPAHHEAGQVHSHKGLGYAGLIYQKKLSFHQVLEIYRLILRHFESLGMKDIHLKETPSFYGDTSQELTSYLLFLAHSEVEKMELSLAIPLPMKVRHASRKNGIHQAKKAGLVIREPGDFKAFWNEVLIPNLRDRHQTSPLHSLADIGYLAQNHKGLIRQFNIYLDEELVAGATVFVTRHSVHTQYLATTKKGRSLHALDFLIYWLCEEVFPEKRYFDFGHSNEEDRQKINWGLFRWKESFGAIPFVHRYFRVPTEGWKKLDEMLGHGPIGLI